MTVLDRMMGQKHVYVQAYLRVPVEQNGEFCRECSLDFYSFTGLSCLACPYGKTPELRSITTFWSATL